MVNVKKFGAVLLFGLLLTQFSCAFYGRASLGSNRRLWQLSRISNYRMTMEIRKTGHQTPSGFALVEVRDGKAVAIERVPDQSFACGMNNCGRYDTVEKLFAVIEDAQKQSPEELITVYDWLYGYPKLIKLDVAKRTFDDELTVKILQFEVFE